MNYRSGVTKLIIGLLIGAATALPAGTGHTDDQAALRQVVDTHPARAAATWQALAGKPIKDRILPAPAVLIDYLIADNQYQGYPDRPRPAVVDSGFLGDITGAVAGIAPAVQPHIRDHVVAIFLARDLGSTAYGELLRDFDTNKMGFIVLDVDALNRRANDWITWRERSPFAGSGPPQLTAGIAKQAGDTRAAAIRYILLHEIGHIVGVAKKAHSSWFDGGDPKDFGFTAISWVAAADGKGADSRFDAAFTQRRRITYYRFKDALLDAAQMVETYRQLAATDFVSLYAATNMYEDFAETYAMYVHVVLQGQSWTVDVHDANGASVLQLMNPILETRCRAKKQYLDRWFR
ncbi:MAG: hypothetical protein ABIL58_10525 [Pseudomonadota bacterium]